MEIEEKKPKALRRLLVDVPEDLHKEIKIRATVRNISIKTWVTRAIAEAIKQEKKYE